MKTLQQGFIRAQPLAPLLNTARVLYFNPRASCEARRSSCDEVIICQHFNPRASCEARLQRLLNEHRVGIFQSTRLLRGATWPTPENGSDTPFQSTRLLRGATIIQDRGAAAGIISIHAPLARRDLAGKDNPCASDISIHAPLARRDRVIACSDLLPEYFNPRASCEARPAKRRRRKSRQYFNPRASCEARPPNTCSGRASGKFQSTRLLRGATPNAARLP